MFHVSGHCKFSLQQLMAEGIYNGLFFYIQEQMGGAAVMTCFSKLSAEGFLKRCSFWKETGQKERLTTEVKSIKADF